MIALSVVENVAVAATAAVLILVPTAIWLLERRSAGSRLMVEIGSRFTFGDGPDPVYFVAITARNTSRRPMKVTSWAIALADGRTIASPLLVPTSTPTLPAVVPPQGERTWYAPAAPIEDLLRRARYPRGAPLHAIVALEGGAEVVSPNAITLGPQRAPTKPRLPHVPARVAGDGANGHRTELAARDPAA